MRKIDVSAEATPNLPTSLHTSDTLSRRTALGAGLLAGFGASLPAVSQSASATALVAANLPVAPEAQNRALVKWLGDTAGGRVIWKSRGTIYAVQPNKVTPLYAMLGSEQSWWRQTGPDAWVRYPCTLSFFRNLQTGAWLTDFENPLTGRTVKLPASFIRHKEGEVFSPMGRWYPAMKKAFPKQYADTPVQLHWDRNGDVVRMHEPSNFPPILPQPSLESATLFSSARELFGRRLTRASGTVAGWNIFAWHPYLDMGDAPGHVIWHFDAVKVAGIDALDSDYLAKAREFTPLFDQSPEQDEGPSFFERILQRRGAATG